MARPWHAYLQAAAVLTGDRDKEYGIERARPGREAIAAPLQRRLEVWNSLAAALPALPPKPALPGTSKVDEAQHLTGAHALACVVAVHEALVDAPRPADDAPLLGARDLALLKRLVALAFAWYVVPAIDAFDAEASASLLQVHDNGTSPALGVLQQVSQTLQSLLTEASPSHASALPTTALARTDVATLVVRTYLSDLFRVWMRVAYADPPSTDAQRMLERVLRLSPTRSALGALRSVPMPSALSQAQVRPPPFVREHVARLLSLQLLRPDGVRAFLQAMLGEQDSDLMASDVGDDVAEGDALFQRLDGVAKVLSTPPKHMARAEYYEAMAPQLLDLIDPVPPPGTTPVPGTHRRAAAFVLERMYQRNAAATAHMLTTLVHQPFAPRDAQATPPAPDAVDRALRRLTAMVTLAPPAPDWVHAACAPVSDRLLSLDSFVHQPATTGISDVTASRARSEQAADTHAVLHTWLRLGPEDEVRASLSRALSNVLDDEWDWTHTPNGVACVVRDTEPAPLDHIGQHILSLDQVKKSMDGENDEPVVLPSDLASSLHFPLDPARLAVLLKGAQRVSLGSSLLLVAMDEYRRVQGAAVSGLTESSSGALERRSVFFLQIVFQLFDTFGKSLMEGDTDKVLQFIDFACATRATADIFESALINAALQLLLALLEGSPTLTLSNTPLLRVIAEHVDKCRDAPDSETRALSQEAAVALRARESMLPTSNANSSNRPAYVDVYQEALRYLQDPILPVRAHGLHLLTQLVATDTRRHPVCYGTVVPDALLPAIFDLLVDAIQDDESFLYLNAVQGLAEMASSHREAVLGPLLAIYVGGDKTKDRMAHALTYGQQLTPREIDQRLRLGEALLQVLQHLGDAAVVESVRNPLFSAALRSSYLAILGTCVETAPGALAASGDGQRLAALCVDIVRATGVARPRRGREHLRAHISSVGPDGRITTAPLDDDDDEREQRDQYEASSGTDTDPKRPHLRRSALLLLTHVLRATCHQADEVLEARQHAIGDIETGLSALRLPGGGLLPSVGGSRTTSVEALPTWLVPPSELPPMAPVLAYVAQEDEDELVRRLARDALDERERCVQAHVAVAAS